MTRLIYFQLLANVHLQQMNKLRYEDNTYV